MFLQQPYHPSYQFLQRLNHMMNSIYANVDAPNLPDPIEGIDIILSLILLLPLQAFQSIINLCFFSWQHMCSACC